MIKRFSYNKNRRGQQIIEFALVAPILLIFIFIVVEMGAAINARVSVAEAVKMSLVEVNKLNNLDGNTTAKITTVENFITAKVIQYLLNHNIPNSGSITVKAVYRPTDNTAFVGVTYEYVPYFLISGLAGNSISTINFSSTQVINPNIFKPNVFPGASLTTQQLSGFFTNVGGNFIPSGALVDNTTLSYSDGTFNIREHIAFLLRYYEAQGTHPFMEYNVAHARLVDWEGNDLLPPNIRINLRTGTLEVRSPYYNTGTWFNTKIPYVWAATSLGFTHLIYVKYNSPGMFLKDNAPLFYKLNFSHTDFFYNKDIMFCGTGGTSGSCSDDQRNAATVNERALRMNPRLGEYTWDNSYIIGTMEPIIVDGVAHDFEHVKGSYYSYTTNYANWNPGSWTSQYVITISCPHVIDTAMADALYHTDMANSAINPFYEPYKYRLKLYEHDHAIVANRGVYNPALAAPSAQDDDLDDGIGGADGNNTYQIDIIDVYIDSDGDGIPDAWDGDPEYFDVNTNGILDGLEIADFWAQSICRGEDIYQNGSLITAGGCSIFPDDVQTVTVPPGTEVLPNIINDTKFIDHEASPTYKYWKSTPYDPNGVLETGRTNRYLPLFTAADFKTYNETGGNKALYYNIDGTNLTRKYPTWWELFVNAAGRRPAKKNFIHAIQSGQDLNLTVSPEINYINTTNIFSATSKVTRTPGGW